MNNHTILLWVLSVLGALLLLLASLLITTLSSLSMRHGILEKQQATMDQKLAQVDSLVNATRQEQIDRTTRFAEVTARIIGVENEQRWIKDRIDSIVARLVAVHGRLESLGATPSKAGDDPFSPRRLTPAPPRED